MKYFLLAVILFLAPPVYGFDLQNLRDSEELDTAYLPFEFQVRAEYYIENDCSYPEHTPYQVARVAVAGESDGLLIFSSNPSPNVGNSSCFTPRIYPSSEVTDDDPIRYTITNWALYQDPVTEDPVVAGVCHSQDSIFAFTLNTVTDVVRYSLILAVDRDKSLPPNAKNMLFADIDADSTYELIFYLEMHRHFRKLVCVDYPSVELEWVCDISSGINNLVMVPDDTVSGNDLLIATRNAANGVSDSIYSDVYSYLTRINPHGEVVFARRAGVYGREIPCLAASDVQGEFFLGHYLDLETGDSLVGKRADQYLLSRIDSYGRSIRSRALDASPLALSVIRDELGIPYLYVPLRGESALVFDMNLRLVDSVSGLASIHYFLGKGRIAEYDDSVLIFDDGVYDPEWNKILQFPFRSSVCTPVEVSHKGDLRSVIIDESMHATIGQINNKRLIALISVFYHRHQIYVIILLTALIVGITVSLYYHRRSVKSAHIIAGQRDDLERAHTALKDAQQAIIAQEKFRQAQSIAGGFAHEIRNSLFPAKSALTKMHEASGERLSDRQWLDRIGSMAALAVDRALELTNRISKYTRIDSEYRPEVVRPGAIVEQVLSDNSALLEQRRIDLQVTLENRSEAVGNAEQLYLVVNNVLINAVDAVTLVEKPRIEIHAAEADSSILIRVKDNGTGFTEDEADKIFDVFYSTKPDSGTGLGLALSRKITELYGGSIEAASDPETGTEFTIVLRIHEEPA